MLLTPGHAAYPAGHATQCHFAVAVLKTLRGITAGDDWDVELTRLADRIGENRVVAGLHYLEDIKVGAALGKTLAVYFDQQRNVAHSAMNWLWTAAAAENAY